MAIDAHVYSSFTTHSLYVAQLAKDAICDKIREATGGRPSVQKENPDLRIAVNLFQGEAQVFVDSSGESLHRRGYRQLAGEAPMRETLAAGVVKLSGWTGTTPLLDPMCGSATLLIEAAWMLRNRAPGYTRRNYGFTKWSDYNPSLYNQLIEEARKAVKPQAKAQIQGYDIDPKMIAIAKENIKRAGLSDLIQVEQRDFFEASEPPAEPGTMVVNPPYDERLEVSDIAEFYQRMGDRLKQGYPGWKVFILSGNLDAARYFGLRSSSRRVLYNGALECRLIEFELRAGERATQPPKYRTLENPKWKMKAEMFGNRLRKNLRRKSQPEGARVYDWDIPELPFIVEKQGEAFTLSEIPRNHDHSLLDHKRYLQVIRGAAAEALKVPPEKILFKSHIANQT